MIRLLETILELLELFSLDELLEELSFLAHERRNETRQYAMREL